MILGAIIAWCLLTVSAGTLFASTTQPLEDSFSFDRFSNKTPTPPPQTPPPIDTFCDIPVSCDIYVYDESAGPSAAIDGATITVDNLCGSETWTTNSSGWASVLFINYNFTLDLVIQAPMYYPFDFTASSSTCPAEIPLIPILTQTPTPPGLRTGDVNHDGTLTAEDAQLAFLIVLGILPFDWVADCNADDEVTSGDAQLIFIAALTAGSCHDPLP